MTHGKIHQNARRLADELLDSHERQDFTALARLVPRMLGTHAPERYLLRPLFLELVCAVATLVRVRSSGDGGTFTVGLTDESKGNSEVDIDELAPALRAVLRAVLADLNDDPESAATQVGFAADDPNPLCRLDALIHLLSWVNELRPSARTQS